MSIFVLSQTKPEIGYYQMPHSRTVSEGNSVVFFINAKCDGPLEFQWRQLQGDTLNQINDGDKNGRVEVTAYNGSKFALLDVKLSEDNLSEFICEVKNTDYYPADSAWTFSDTVTLTVTPTSKTFGFIYPFDRTGYKFEVGQTIEIYWVAEENNSVNLSYSANDGKDWHQIISNYSSANNTYNWEIPNTPSIFCLLKISDSNDETMFDISPYSRKSKWFTIYGENKWVEIPVNFSYNLKEIKFIDDQNGFAYSNSVLIITEDSGLNWKVKSTFESYNFHKVIFVDNNNGWALIRGSVYLYKTTDGGLTWQVLEAPAPYDGRNISFVDVEYGWLTNGSSIYKSIDGGVTWEFVYKSDYDIISIEFLNRNFGWYLAYSGYLFFNISNDGGIGWSFSDEWSAGWYAKLYYTDELHGWKTTGDEYSWAYGRHGLYKTINGTDFTELYYGTFDPNEISFFNSQIGWMSGYTIKPYGESGYNTADRPFICMSVDSGNSWKLQSFDQGAINSIYTYDGETVWAVGKNGLIMKLGGSTPTLANKIDYSFTVESPFDTLVYKLTSGSFLEGESYVADTLDLPRPFKQLGGQIGILEGTRFSIDKYAINENISLDIRFMGLDLNDLERITSPVDGTPLFMFLGIEVTGENSGVTSFEDFYHFNEGKKARICIPRTARFLELLDSLEIDENEISFAYLKGGEYFDEGLEWEIKEGQEGEVDSLCLYLDHFSQIVGGKNLVTSLKKQDEQLPTEYKLYQNYPNPFNPTTTIKYSVPNIEMKSSASLQLKVYDVLGKEVKTLVSKIKKPGSYEVTFNASNLSSGVYYYQLKAGDFIQTKKMILLR